MKMIIATGVLAAGPRVWAAERTGEIPRCELGRTGEKVSCIGPGGSDIGKVEDEQKASASCAEPANVSRPYWH